MDVNAVTKGGAAAASQTSTGSARPSSVAAPAPDHGPALRIESSQKAPLRALEGQAEATGAKTAGIEGPSASEQEHLKDAKKLQALIGDKNMQLTTYHDEASGRSVLEVSDQTTGKVVSQYPSDELLRLYAALREPLVDRSA